MKQRLFIALSLPENVKALLQQYQDDLKKQLPDVKVTWVKPATMHLTLIFLGQTSTKQEELERAVQFAVRRIKPFSLTTGTIGAFPSFSRPSVLWLGVDGDLQILSALHKKLEQSLEGFYKPDGRAYKPHLTLGRIKTFGQGEIIGDALMNFELQEKLSWQVKSVELYSSELTAAGAQYTLLYKEPLAID